MGLLTLLEDGNPLFKYYSGGTGGKGYTGGGTTPGMKSVPFPTADENGKPLITFDINNNGTSDVNNIGLLQSIGNLEGGDSGDFLLRGGLQTPLRSAIDVARLNRWNDNPTNADGLMFFIKQNLLSRINPKTEATFGLGYGINGFSNAGVYNPINTIAQAGVTAFGIHLNKQGILGTDFNILGGNSITGINKYEDVTNTQNAENFDKQRNVFGQGGNRLVLLKNAIDGNVDSFSLNSNKLNRYKFNTGDGVNVISYGGGPGAGLGIGQTHIRFASERTGKQNVKLLNTNFFSGTENAGGVDLLGFLTNPIAETAGRPTRGDFSVFKRPEIKFAGNNIFNGKGVSGLYSTLTNVNLKLTQYGIEPDSSNLYKFETSVYTPPEAGTFPENTDRIGKGSWSQQDFIDQDRTKDSETLEDFRTKLSPTEQPQNTFLSVSPSYKSKRIEQRVLLGDPGKKGNVSNYQTGKRDLSGIKIGATDKITALPIYRSSGVTQDFGLKNDLCKFRIAIIDPTEPNQKSFIHFRAFLNSFSDGYKASWKGQKYMGRGEEFYKYDGFSRDISISFTVAAQSKEELYPMYKKLNFLASSLAPTYTKAGYMAGNLSQMTVGGYLFEQPGFIESVDYDIPDESPWEIGVPSGDIPRSIGNQGFEDSELKEMPHIINVSLKFTPIHRFRPSIMTLGDKPNTANSGLKDGNVYGNQRFIAIDDGKSTGYDSPPPPAPSVENEDPNNGGLSSTGTVIIDGQDTGLTQEQLDTIYSI